MTDLMIVLKDHMMKRSNVQICLVSLTCALTLFSSCLEDEPQQSPLSPVSSPSERVTFDAKMDLPLAPPPQTWTIEIEERASSDGLMELLWSIYDEHIHGRTAHPHPPEEDSFEESQGGCHECGRETGFLPTPEVGLESVSELDHKATSFVTLNWGAVEGANSYRVFLLQVDEAREAVTETSSADVHTEHAGLGLEHGFSYVMYVIAYHEISKDYSIPSEPVLMRCSLSYGCALLTETME